MADIPLISIIFGIISTIVLHIAKSMERQGIEIFDQIRSKVKNENLSDELKGKKKPIIYTIGLILNNTVFIYAMVANMFGEAPYYTSMFGIGLIALMLYSTKVLKESIKKIEYIGAIVLVTGTLFLGIESIYRPDYAEPINLTIAFTCIFIFMGLAAILCTIAYRKNIIAFVGIVFGLFAGGFGGLDPVLKAIGQSEGGSEGGFLPSTPVGWLIFLISFIAGTAAFILTQWGFAKKAPASVLVPCYNSLYVILPILLYALALPGFAVTPITIIGVALTIVGIVLMQAFKRTTPVPHK
jgi:hypothetical protein